jgi:hypothetical protein
MNIGRRGIDGDVLAERNAGGPRSPRTAGSADALNSTTCGMAIAKIVKCGNTRSADDGRIAVPAHGFEEAENRPCWDTRARSPVRDSSISGRIACKSSVAETTGNNKSRRQPSTIADGRTCLPRTPARRACHHSHKAGIVRSSQNRLSVSSIGARSNDEDC